MKKILLGTTALVAGVLISGSVFAQSVQTGAGGAAGEAQANNNDANVVEVIVTAERRRSSVQKTAASVAVRTGDDLKIQGRYTLSQVLEDVVGVSITSPAGVVPGSGDAPGASVVIRGAVPNTAAVGNAIVPTAAVYTDGIYSGLGGGYDLDRVEVLRGPQGTLYGRSATAGVVAFHTKAPILGRFGADATAEFGSYNLLHDSLGINIPLGDQVAIRAAGNYFSKDGFDSAKGGYLRSTDAKIKLLYHPNDVASLLVGAAMEDNRPNAGGISYSQTQPGVPFDDSTIPSDASKTFYEQSSAVVTDNVNRSRQYWAEMNFDLGFGTLTYLPAYRTYEEKSSSGGFGPLSIPLVTAINTPSDTFITHELRLASSSGARIIWQVGALYYRNSYASIYHGYRSDTDDLVSLENIAKNTTDVGFFGETTVPLGMTWRATLGIRYDHTKVVAREDYTVASNPFGLAPIPNVISSSSIEGSDGVSNYDNITFKMRLEKDLTAASRIYGVISTGFLPGDVQVTTLGFGPSAVAGAVRYDQQKLTAYEIGLKNEFFGRKLRLNGDIFYYDYTGYQTSTLTSPYNPAYAIVTSPAKMYGVELDSVLALTAQDKISLTYGYTNARFVDRPSCPNSTTTVCFADVIANEDIPGIAPHAFTAGYDHHLTLSGGASVDFHASARYASAHDLTNILPVQTPYEPYNRVGDQWTGDASVTWTPSAGAYSVTAYVRNISDNRYKTSVQLSGVDTSFSSTATRFEPRTFGLIVQAHY